MCDAKFYICSVCGNLVGMIHASGVPMICCGKPMKALTPGEVEASREKHLPAVSAADGAVRVTVGSVLHPMAEEHSIEWIYLQTTLGGQRKCLKPDAAPEAVFALADGEEALAAYAYCNLHGLWKTTL